MLNHQRVSIARGYRYPMDIDQFHPSPPLREALTEFADMLNTAGLEVEKARAEDGTFEDGKSGWKLEVFMERHRNTLENHIEATFKCGNHRTVDYFFRDVWHQRVPLKRALPQAPWLWLMIFFQGLHYFCFGSSGDGLCPFGSIHKPPRRLAGCGTRWCHIILELDWCH